MPSRTPLAVLNELSVPNREQNAPVGSLIGQLADTLRIVYRLRPDIGFTATQPIAAIPITRTGLTMGSLAAREGGRLLDQWRFILGRSNVAPITHLPQVRLPELHEEFSFGGRESIGLGVAAINDQLAVSFASSSEWDAASVDVDCLRLVEDPDSGSILEERWTKASKHASGPNHIDENHDFVVSLALSHPFAGEDLWSDREIRYPKLKFLPRVRNQMIALGAGGEAVVKVDEQLRQLNAAVADWDPTSSPLPRWRMRVNPESETRRQLCWFDDFDGTRQCFHLHAYFQPGPGRIHFRLVTDLGRSEARIAHIGRKLGI